MKIVIICPSKDMTCGIGNYSQSLVNALKEKAEVLYSNEVNQKVLEFKPDVVNFQWEYALYDAKGVTAALNLLKIKKVRTSITLHGFSDYDSKNQIIESMFDEYIVLNEGFKKQLIKRGIEKPIYVIPMGVQSYEFGKEERAFVRDLLGIDENELVIGAFGFLELYKNFHTILEALAELKMGMFLLCAYSKEPNNEYANELNQIAVNLRVKYRHLGNYLRIESIAKVLHACDVLVYPYIDVFTYSSSAAIRMGISSLSPVIANDITFFDDVHDVNEGGPVYKVRNGLTSSVKKVLTDEQLRKTLIENSREFIKQNSWDNIADRYLKVVHVSDCS